MAEQFLPTRIGIPGTLRQTFALLETLLPGGASYSASPPSPELGFPAAFPPSSTQPSQPGCEDEICSMNLRRQGWDGPGFLLF